MAKKWKTIRKKADAVKLVKENAREKIGSPRPTSVIPEREESEVWCPTCQARTAKDCYCYDEYLESMG